MSLYIFFTHLFLISFWYDCLDCRSCSLMSTSLLLRQLRHPGFSSTRIPGYMFAWRLVSFNNVNSPLSPQVQVPRHYYKFLAARRSFFVSSEYFFASLDSFFFLRGWFFTARDCFYSLKWFASSRIQLSLSLSSDRIALCEELFAFGVSLPCVRTLLCNTGLPLPQYYVLSGHTVRRRYFS